MPRFKRTFDDSLFYFQVGESKTFNKFEAIMWANGDVSKIHFYFLDDIWDNMDMMTEPEETWDSLMRERCLSLRDQYQTLSISYSGGYDCQTILDHCIANDVRVDELVCSTWEYFWDTKGWQQPEGHSAPRLAQWYKDHVFPNLKISKLPRTVDYIVKLHQRNDNDMMFVDNAEIGFVKNHRALHLNNSDIGAGVLAHNTKVILDGHEKPFLKIKDGWWVMSLSDTQMPFSINSPYEAFYLAKDHPKLHLKQTHMMINWLESLPAKTIDDVDVHLKNCRNRPGMDNWFYYRYNMAVGRTPVKHWNSFDCQASGKFNGWSNGLFDRNTQNFYRAHGNSEEVKAVIRKWYHNTKNFVDNYASAFENGNHKIVWSKEYRIKPVEPARNLKLAA